MTFVTEFNHHAQFKGNGLGYLNYGRTLMDEITGAGSIFGYAYLPSGGTNARLVGSGENSNGYGVELVIDNTSQVNNGMFLYGDNAIQTDSGYNVVPSVFRPEFMGATWDGTNIIFYARGRPARTVADTFQPTGHANRTTRLAYRGAGATDPANIRRAVTLVWNRAITAGEYKALWLNPWQVFARPTRYYFFGAAASGGAITASSISSDEAFGAAVLTTGMVNVAPSAVASAETFGTAVITSAAINLLPLSITSEEAFGTSSVYTSITLLPSAIDSLEAFGAAILTGTYELLPAGIASAEALGWHSITGGDTSSASIRWFIKMRGQIVGTVNVHHTPLKSRH
jgi:hypothetical protein